MVNEIQTVTGRTGASTRAHSSLIKKTPCSGTASQGSGTCYTQDPYLVRPGTDATEMYVSFWRKLPADLLQKNTCTACHAPDRKLVGPSWADVARKHAGKADYLAGKIRSGGSGVWGNIPMPPQSISADEANRIAAWLAGGAAP